MYTEKELWFYWEICEKEQRLSFTTWIFRWYRIFLLSSLPEGGIAPGGFSTQMDDDPDFHVCDLGTTKYDVRSKEKNCDAQM